MPGNSSWMLYAPQGVTGLADDDEVYILIPYFLCYVSYSCMQASTSTQRQ
jgi:hypothetical protein